MTKNKPIITSRISKQIKPCPLIDLCSKRDKSIYFWSWGGYLLCNAIITQKKKQKLTLFSF